MKVCANAPCYTNVFDIGSFHIHRNYTLSSAELSRLFNSAKRQSINYDFINVNKREVLDCNE